jgi:hypothetical protein
MKQKNMLKQVMFMLLVALIILACSGGAVAATATPVPTNTATPKPTNTVTPKPTDTPVPTATLVPTPASVGDAVQSEEFEVKVIDAVIRDRVYPGGKFYFTPADGYMLVDIGVKVANISSSSLWRVKWGDIYIMNENQEWWYPSWGTFKETSDELDPFAIGVSEVEIDPEAEITLEKTGFLRLFYHIPKGETYYFGFSDSPFTEIKFK